MAALRLTETDDLAQRQIGTLSGGSGNGCSSPKRWRPMPNYSCSTNPRQGSMHRWSRASRICCTGSTGGCRRWYRAMT